ncbi:hypothetical protein [Coleofasciculus sp. G2-EDA-02]|uniref:hypothetical protein n=1 Tax=unclassified Coleofasciculus TaxID=2692782 RepID=UPI0032FC679B
MMTGKRQISSPRLSAVSKRSSVAKQLTISIESPHLGGCRVHLMKAKRDGV